MHKITYYSIHVPTGKTFISSEEFSSEDYFYRCLDRWNYIGRGIWLYTSMPAVPDPLLPVMTVEEWRKRLPISSWIPKEICTLLDTEEDKK